MKLFIVLALLVAAVAAAPANPESEAVIVEQTFDNIGVDGYLARSETSNGIVQESKGELVNGGTENAFLRSSGRFSYTGLDGLLYEVNWIGDENGFQATGAHIPRA